jgi:branched-chain amino acid transport system substrate-binding protein
LQPQARGCIKAKATFRQNDKKIITGGRLMRLIAVLVSGAGLLSAAVIGPAFAQQAIPPLKIGVLADFSSVYSDIGGTGNLEAAKMAIEDFGGLMFGKPIELVSADVQNKADVAASIARIGGRTKAST